MKDSLLQRFWVTFVATTIGLYASGCNRFRTEGSEHIPRQGGVLFAANHISGYETVLLPWAILKKQPWQMIWAPAKEELFTHPFLRWFFLSLGAFPIKRGRDVRATAVLGKLLRAEKVMLFPEGTRRPDGTLGKGNRGVGKLIYDARPIVIPVALSGLNHWRFPGLGQRGAARFGAPLDLSDLYLLDDHKETHQLIVERVMAAIAEQLKLTS
ncbi:MAG: 1-acyl-sn-glycerol-3-phosphate acyltransferase [Desulfuromonadales bacterium]|nr:1-acyl-sn-glycerol-3-phosphate acyltransferase [Desulfuromonadales bacterium]